MCWTNIVYEIDHCTAFGPCSTCHMSPTSLLVWTNIMHQDVAKGLEKEARTVLKLLEVTAIVGRQSHSSFDREFLHQVHGIPTISNYSCYLEQF